MKMACTKFCLLTVIFPCSSLHSFQITGALVDLNGFFVSNDLYLSGSTTAHGPMGAYLRFPLL